MVPLTIHGGVVGQDVDVCLPTPQNCTSDVQFRGVGGHPDTEVGVTTLAGLTILDGLGGIDLRIQAVKKMKLLLVWP